MHPITQQVIFGQEFSLSVAVKSPSHQCTFQWYKNYARLHGKTDTKLIVKSAVDSDTGEYFCMVANKGGSSDSEIAFVKVVNPHTGPSFVEHQQMPHGPSMLTNWSGEGAKRPHTLESLASRGVGVSNRMGPPLGHFSAENLIGQGYLEDGQPMSWGEGGGGVGVGGGVLSGAEELIGGGSSGLGSGKFLSRSGATSLGQLYNS